jgi:hypothetical protein
VHRGHRGAVAAARGGERALLGRPEVLEKRLEALAEA